MKLFKILYLDNGVKKEMKINGTDAVDAEVNFLFLTNAKNYNTDSGNEIEILDSIAI